MAKPARKSVFLKYLALQLPGWLLLLILLRILTPQMDLPFWAGTGLLVLWVAKDLALYPLLRRAYEDDPRTGAERLVGLRGITVTCLAPQGYIRIRGELWQARLRAPNDVIPEGTPVTVRGARNLLLAVDRD